MIDLKQIIIDRTDIYRTQFATENYTVNTIDSLIGKEGRPTGRISGIAWDNARLEVLNEERSQNRINKLKEMFPSITNEDIEKINITDEDNDGEGLILKTKEMGEI